MSGPARWGDIAERPVEFEPLEHPIRKVTGLETALDARERIANRDQPNGYPGLGADGKIAAPRIPFGTAVGSVCEGNDARLSDARPPRSHTHLRAQITDFAHAHVQADVTGLVADLAAKESNANRGQPNGYAALGSDGRVPASQVGVSFMRKPSDQAASVTALADCTGLSFEVAANTDYAFSFVIVFQSAATSTGLALSINGPAAPIETAWMSEIQLTGGASTTASQEKALAAPDVSHVTSSIDAANTRRVARLEGVWRNGANAGTVTVRFASEVAGSAVTIKRGSWGMVF